MRRRTSRSTSTSKRARRGLRRYSLLEVLSGLEESNLFLINHMQEEELTLELAKKSADQKVEKKQKDAGMQLTELRVDGGAANSDVLLQIQADLLGAEVVRPQNVETTVMGAAFLAGLGVGFWEDEAALAATWRQGARLRPSGRDLQSLRAGWRNALRRAAGWAAP